MMLLRLLFLMGIRRYLFLNGVDGIETDTIVALAFLDRLAVYLGEQGLLLQYFALVGALSNLR